MKNGSKTREGVLSDNRYTEYSRAVMALKSIGKDPTDIGGYDIEKPLEDFDAVVSQGSQRCRLLH